MPNLDGPSPLCEHAQRYRKTIPHTVLLWRLSQTSQTLAKQNIRCWELPANFAYTCHRCVHVSRVHVCNVSMHICMYRQMHSSQRVRQPFFVHLSGARNVACNDQQEGGNGIDTSREHSRKLPRCHSGRTCRSEREASRGELGQHATWLTDTAGTAARGFPNHAFSSYHQ